MNLPLVGRLALALVVIAAPLRAQTPVLHIERAGRATAELSLPALRQLATDTLSFSSHGAPPVRYRAVRLTDVLAAAGSPVDSLRMGKSAWVVAAVARDGYVATFSAGELDPKLGPSRVWLAFERDGTPLAADEAPFRLIVPTDAKASRNAHQVTTLRIIDALAPGAR